MASPTHNTAKRSLEETSPGQDTAPDAKRPALDQAAGEVKQVVVKTEEKAAANGGAKPAGEEGAAAVKDDGAAAVGGEQNGQIGVVDDQQNQGQQVDESNWIHIRAIVSNTEAATIIGRGGENITQIRRTAETKLTISDYQRGAVERVLTISGPVDSVAKAFGLIVRTLNQEPLDQASTPQSKAYNLRLLVPAILIGAVIGRGGSRIREIQEASGARINASDSCLPLSGERCLTVYGVADAIHIATYYVTKTLVEQLTERFGGPAASAYASRNGAPIGVMPGGMQVVPYVPQAVSGTYGHPDTYRRHTNHAQRTPANPYGMPYLHGQPPAAPLQAPIHYADPAAAAAGPGYGGAGPHQPVPTAPQHPSQAGQPQPNAMGALLPGQPLTQQIYIPNDMVGAIIGKGGAKINEIRQLSGSVIKINEPQDNSNERLVTITGTQECNQIALYMLYSRLESEKHRA